MKKEKEHKPTFARGKQEHAAKILTRILKPLMGTKEGSLEARLLSEWPAIVGADLAEKTWPRAVKYKGKEQRSATLELQVDDAFAAELHYWKEYMLERIAIYTGHKSIQQVKILARPKTTTSKEKKHTPLAKPAAGARLHSESHSALVESVTDPTLRDVLKKFLQ